jgi:hypothetical protein
MLLISLGFFLSSFCILFGLRILAVLLFLCIYYGVLYMERDRFTSGNYKRHDCLSPFTQWPLGCCQSPQTCTAFAEIFLHLNFADQLEVEPTVQSL